MLRASGVWLASTSLLASASQTLLLKWQDGQTIVYCSGLSCHDVVYSAIALQGLLLFIGKACGFIAAPRSINKITRSEWLFWGIAGSLDVGETMLLNISLELVYSSTAVILNNFMIIFGMLFTIAILRRNLRIHHYSGCLILLSSILIMIQRGEDVESVSIPVSYYLGVGAAISSAAVHALQLIYEEWLIKRFGTSSEHGVAIEGIIGIGLVLLVSPILYTRPETSLWATTLMNFRFGWLGLSSLVFIILSTASEISAIAITRFSSSLTRVVVMSLKPILVLVMESLFGWNSLQWHYFVILASMFTGISLYVLTWPWTELSFSGKLQYEVRLRREAESQYEHGAILV